MYDKDVGMRTYMINVSDCLCIYLENQFGSLTLRPRVFLLIICSICSNTYALRTASSTFPFFYQDSSPASSVDIFCRVQLIKNNYVDHI
jgi:hypothetical protein